MEDFIGILVFLFLFNFVLAAYASRKFKTSSAFWLTFLFGILGLIAAALIALYDSLNPLKNL